MSFQSRNSVTRSDIGISQVCSIVSSLGRKLYYIHRNKCHSFHLPDVATYLGTMYCGIHARLQRIPHHSVAALVPSTIPNVGLGPRYHLRALSTKYSEAPSQTAPPTTTV